MPQFSWVKNDTKVDQSWGPYTVASGQLGLIPAEAVCGAVPSGVRVVSEDPAVWMFRRTEHAPFNARYTERGG